jgi:poly(3-hydroxybutyrate) depolymerase
MNRAQHRLTINKTAAYALAVLFVMLAGCATLFFMSSGCGTSSDFTSGERTIISNGIERNYYVRLPGQYDSCTPLPLIFVFHGFSSDYTFFTQGHTDLQDAVGNGAILVYPNALSINGGTQWDYERDLVFFDDLYAELEANLCFDKRKVFAAGHSNGAGFTHTLGCKRGNILRAIGPVSGSFSDYDNCTGRVAVIMIQGSSDTVIPLEQTKPTLAYWVARNSCSSKADETTQGVDHTCQSYRGCNSKFPVQYCEHTGGHDWPAFAGQAIWDFFLSLPSAQPSRFPGFGKDPQETAGTVSFKIHFPVDFAGTPEKLAVSLYPAGSSLPLSGGPSYILNMDVPLGAFTPGDVTAYKNVAVSLSGVDYGDYAMAVNIYMQGGSYPIPTSGMDYMGLQDITISSSTIVVRTPFELSVLVY